MRVWLVFPVLLPLAACVTVHPSVDQACLANGHCNARPAEPQFLRPHRAERSGNTLTLFPSAAAPIGLSGDPKICEAGDVPHCALYVLEADHPKSHTWVVEQFFYEGSTFLLIDDRSGRRTQLNGMPTFSPDGTRFLVAPFSDENDVGPNNLEIWRREGDGAVLEWAHPASAVLAEDPQLPSPYMVTVRRWQGDRIDLILSTESLAGHQWDGTLTHDINGWHLSAKSPAGLLKRE